MLNRVENVHHEMQKKYLNFVFDIFLTYINECLFMLRIHACLKLSLIEALPHRGMALNPRSAHPICINARESYISINISTCTSSTS